MRGWLALGTALACALAAAPVAAAEVQPYGTNDFGGFHNILPPGANGLLDTAQLATYLALGQRPPHNNDQLGMYSSLTTAAPGITAAQIPNFYKDATFGVPAGDVASSESPTPGVTIVRDQAYGVPHIYGDTRAALMFGIGWATAEDRLFFIDALRHSGQGDLAAFAGGANVAMDQSVWSSEPYTQADLAAQVAYVAHGPDGPQILSDASNYVDGINAYIDRAGNPLFTATTLPAEYVALGVRPAHFTVKDLVSIATLVGGIFGNGGGGQLSNAVLYEQLRQRFGHERRLVAGAPELVSSKVARRARHRPDHSGFATFLSFADPSDPEAPTTVRGRSFPYQTLPRPSRAVLKTTALPDPRSVQWTNHVVAGGPTKAARRPLLISHASMSNALLVSAAHSASGHPLAVMGPQVSYYTPEILMEEDIHGPGIDAAGAAFPGVNLYVELGHGRDYAWSATSSGQGIIDTFAVPLCGPGGVGSDSYVLQGRCVPMETLTRSESWQSNLADPTPSGSITLQTQRTAYGIVIARATVDGRPVAYCNLRSTYMHELDSAVGFERFNEPAAMRNPRAFMDAAYQVGYTFNWFYADDQHIAYFNSGLNPVRAANTDPLFPAWSKYAWSGFSGAPAMTPGSLVERQTPERAHPQAIDQSYLTSWNNKQAPGYNDANTSQQFSPVYRSQLLDAGIESALAVGHGKMTLADLVNAMGNAGTQDLRGVQVLPYALRIIGSPPADLAPAVSELQNWVATGAHRINRFNPGAHGLYEQSDAIRIMDGWWPLLLGADFGPILGQPLLSSVEAKFAINDQPGHGTSGAHLGSAWDVGFYGVVQKDLRAALGGRVAGPLNRVYCGAGSLDRCRAALIASLRQAVGEPASEVYPADGVCLAGDQMCSDSIQFRAIGAVTQPLIEWINRPTFQQAVEIDGHGPR